MRTHNRTKLIRDLNETALGLVAEAELAPPEKTYDLVELAGTLDKLRVALLQKRHYPLSTTQYIDVVPANCA